MGSRGGAGSQGSPGVPGGLGRLTSLGCRVRRGRLSDSRGNLSRSCTEGCTQIATGSPRRVHGSRQERSFMYFDVMTPSEERVATAALMGAGRSQHGVVTRDQIAAVLTRRQLDRWVSTGRLVRAASGQWRLAGSPVSWRQRAMGVCLAYGPPAAISHTAAARLWGLERSMRMLRRPVAGHRTGDEARAPMVSSSCTTAYSRPWRGGGCQRPGAAGPVARAVHVVGRPRRRLTSVVAAGVQLPAVRLRRVEPVRNSLPTRAVVGALERCRCHDRRRCAPPPRLGVLQRPPRSLQCAHRRLDGT